MIVEKQFFKANQESIDIYQQLQEQAKKSEEPFADSDFVANKKAIAQNFLTFIFDHVGITSSGFKWERAIEVFGKKMEFFNGEI